MAELEIRLVGHSGRVREVYMVNVDTMQEAVASADALVKNDPEVAGAQVASAPPFESFTIH